MNSTMQATDKQRITQLEQVNEVAEEKAHDDRTIGIKEVYERVIVLETKFDGSFNENVKTRTLFRVLVNWIFFGLLVNALLSIYIIYMS